MSYQDFLNGKAHLADSGGFKPKFMPDFLYPFQADTVEWAIRHGRAGIFADCGLGKTPMQLVWAQNVFKKTGKPVLIATPIAVGYQTVTEGEKFGIECARSDGKVTGPITVTNYEKLHLFNPDDYSGMVCDESSILKNFNGVRKAEVTEFMRMMPYRLLCTATAAPNDYTELGTSSEALGHMGYMDMLGMFFKNDQNTVDTGRRFAVQGGKVGWRFKHHAEHPFWRWVCSWARAMRKPSDIGHSDEGYNLPPLKEIETVVDASRPLDGQLFARPAECLQEMREETRATLTERCEKAAEIATHKRPVVLWCNLNDEGDLLSKLIPDAAQVSGSMPDEKKEERLLAFSRGELRALITKPKIGGFGLNWQHCSDVVFFPTHSYEQYYQAVRRCYRFGQKKPVDVNIITSEGGVNALKSLQRKAQAADRMFSALVEHMADELKIQKENLLVKKEEVPTWL